MSSSLAGPRPLMRLNRHDGPAILAARLWLPGGSAADPAGAAGAHQLLASLLTRGCGGLNAEAMADLVEGYGAGLRCDAHEDAVVVSLKCASDDAPALLPLLGSMLREPRLEQDQLTLERDLTIQTLRRNREDPFQLALDDLRHLLYDTGPYGHDPLGSEAGLARIDRACLRDLAEAQGRRPIALAFDGHIPTSLAGRLPDLLELPPAPAGPVAVRSPQGAPRQRRRLALCEADTEQLVLMFGSATVPLGHPDDLALQLLQCHLGVGMSSRLFQSLREERGLAYEVSAHHPPRLGPSPFVLSMSSGIDRAGEAARGLAEEWQRLLDQPLDERERLLAVAKFRGHLAHSRQTCSQRADRAALLLAHGLPDDFDDRRSARAADLDSATILAAARRRLGRPVLALCGPAAAAEQAVSQLPAGMAAAPADR